jgi:hypothetical protein
MVWTISQGRDAQALKAARGRLAMMVQTLARMEARPPWLMQPSMRDAADAAWHNGPPGKALLEPSPPTHDGNQGVRGGPRANGIVNSRKSDHPADRANY